MPEDEGKLQVTINDASETIIVPEPKLPKTVLKIGGNADATTDKTASDSGQN